MKMKTITLKINLNDLMKKGNELVIKVGNFDREHPDSPDDMGISMFGFMEGIIDELKAQNRQRTMETYICALNSFKRYRNNKDISIADIDSRLMESYQNSLKNNRITMNTISFYMRILRAVYNKAVRRNLVTDAKPFRSVYTSIAKTVKRALSTDDIMRLKNYRPADKAEAFAIDMFFFSLYTRGMAMVDIASLRKTDLSDNVLTYTRKKTGQRLRIQWNRHIQAIIDRNPSTTDKYLLPIIARQNGKERNQFRYRQGQINETLKKISAKLNLAQSITMYVARHSWASIARSMNIPISVISHGMGHNSEKTTMIYLKEADNDAINRANIQIINAFEKNRD